MVKLLLCLEGFAQASSLLMVGKRQWRGNQHPAGSSRYRHEQKEQTSDCITVVQTPKTIIMGSA
jgi:hypothetical protein